MVRFRRNKPDNLDAEFFLTIVTYNRKTWLASEPDRDFILSAMGEIRDRYNLKFLAWVILPEHIHWLLAPYETDYSKVVFTFKKTVSSEYKMRGLISSGDKFWHRRFWEHTVRDDEDRQRCVEYTHYNPVKHGLVSSPRDWRYSSFYKYVERGIYPVDWSEGEKIDIPGSEFDI